MAAIAALSSCGNDDVIVNENENEKHKVEAPVFTATIEGEATTRTQLATGSADNKKKVEWLVTDKVFVYSIVGLTDPTATSSTVNNTDFTPVAIGNYAVTPGSTDASAATLTPDGDLIWPSSGTPGITLAIYPSSVSFFNEYYQTNPEETKSALNSTENTTKAMAFGQVAVGVHVPATQTYNGNDISQIAPMAAYITSGTELKFYNVSALLAITVPSSQISSVKKITVSSDKKLNGYIGLESRDDGLTLDINGLDPEEGENTLTLDCTNSGSNTTIPAEGTTFYVSIPPQTYGYLQFDVTDGTNTKTMKTTATSITVARNKIYPIAFEENQTPKLKIKVTSSDITELKAIKVVTDQNIDGDNNYKELVFSSVQTPAADGTVYSINIPAQTYEYYKIYLSADGTTYKEAMASTTAVGAISGPVNIDYEKNAVQLWADGPYFATMNVGETAVGGKTAKYAWGATSADGAANATTDSGNNTTAGTYDDDHDTAYKIWGSAWRMPKQGEFEAMSSNCTLGYGSGTFTFTGKGDYSSAKVSFPSYNVGQSYMAEYWTSTVNEDGNVYHGSFQNNQGNFDFKYSTAQKPVDNNGTVLKYFVRAVLR